MRTLFRSVCSPRGIVGWQLIHLLFMRSWLAENLRGKIPPIETEVWQSVQVTDSGWIREGSHISGVFRFPWQLMQKIGWVEVKRTNPNPGMAASTKITAMINAQVRLGSLGSDGIFIASLCILEILSYMGVF